MPESKTKSIYLAGPLFTAAEKNFNVSIYNILAEHGYKVFLPQEECQHQIGEGIFITCRSGLEKSAIVLAILDGADADSGTCWECGYAVAQSKPVILLRTDIRDSGDTRGFNAMLFYSAFAIIEEQEKFMDQIVAAIESCEI